MKTKALYWAAAVAAIGSIVALVVFLCSPDREALERDFRQLTTREGASRPDAREALERIVVHPASREFLRDTFATAVSAGEPTENEIIDAQLAMQVLWERHRDEELRVVMMDALLGKISVHPHLRGHFPRMLATRRPSLDQLPIFIRLLAHPTEKYELSDGPHVVPWFDMAEMAVWRLIGVLPATEVPRRIQDDEALADYWAGWWKDNKDYLCWAEDFGAFVIDPEAKSAGRPTENLRDPGWIELVTREELAARRKALRGKYTLPRRSLWEGR